MSDTLGIERLKIDQYKARLDYDRLNLEREISSYERQKTMFDAVVRFAILAIKSIILCNGIAALALLGVLCFTYPSLVQNPYITRTIQFFGFGALSGVLSVGFAYLTQIVFAESQSPKVIKFLGGGFRIVAIFSAFCGVWFLFEGISFVGVMFNANEGKQVLEIQPVSFIQLLTAAAPYAWPLSIILLALIFKEQIKDIQKRLIRVGKDGAEFAHPQQNETTRKPIDENELNKVSATPDPTILPWIQRLETEIQERRFSDTELLARLKSSLAANIRNANFERISRIILGTQISALRHLSTSGGLGVNELEKIYSSHVERATENKIDFVAWIGFLQGNELMKFEELKYVITDIGRLYLDFAQANGINEARWG